GVLLEVVADPRDVGGDLDAACQADAGDLPKSGVRLLRGGGEHARADTAALRRAPERGALRLDPRALAPLLDKLLCGRHRSRVCTLSLACSPLIESDKKALAGWPKPQGTWVTGCSLRGPLKTYSRR